MNPTKAKRMTVVQAVFLARQADKIFCQAAKAWIRGNNSGDSKTLTRCEKRCDKLRRNAESLLAPLGIEIDYPGLYPSFKVNGFEEHSTLGAISAALEKQ